MAETISVIVPCFNQESTIGQTLQSICEQEGCLLEVIVVDDGSTDGSLKKIHAFIAAQHKKDSVKIHVLSQKNAGVIAACNAGLNKATGSYVLRVDGDDLLPKSYIKTLYGALQKRPKSVGYAYCDAEYFGGRTGELKSQPYSLGRLMSENYIHVSALVRRSCLEKSGYFNPAMHGGYEDWEFWVRLARHGYKGVYVPGPKLLYRQHAHPQRNQIDEPKGAELRTLIKQENWALYRNPAARLQNYVWRGVNKIRQKLLV